jgi:DNA modification methylase
VINASPEIRRVPVKSLKPAPYNPRRIDPAAMAGLEKSLERFGVVEPIIFNQRSGFVVGGHQRLKVLRRMKVSQADVVVVDLDDTDEKALNLALNNLAITGEFSDKLAGLLHEIGTANAALFADLRLDSLLVTAEAARRTFRDRAEDIPALPTTAKTKPGDLYILGRHRLLCGDSTDPAAMDLLMNGEKATLALTDPPYSVGYSISFGKREGKKDPGRQSNYQESSVPGALLEGFLKLMPGLVVMTYSLDRNMIELAAAMTATGYASIRELVWVKDSPSFHPGMAYQQMHEPILILRRDGIIFPKTIPSTAKTVLAFPRPRSHEDHPTAKPLDLWTQLVEWHSSPSDLIVDPFGGSGTTLMAAEGASRRCYSMELAPAFCDVIVERWQAATGAKAIRHGNTP